MALKPPTSDFFLELAKGSLDGLSAVHKFGRNGDVDITGAEDIWDGGGLWVPPTAARIHNIVSDSANDAGSLVSSGTATGGSLTTLVDSSADFVSDGVGVGDTILATNTKEHSLVTAITATTLTCAETKHGATFKNGDTYKVVAASSTGASVLHVYGLDSNMYEQSEWIILNGTSNVATVNSYYRIHRMHIDGAASRITTNAGVITATAVTDATVTAQINASVGTTFMAIYTVPRGKNAYMLNLWSSVNRSGNAAQAMADMAILETPFAETGLTGTRSIHYWALAINGSNQHQHFFQPYRKFEQITDIIVRCEGVTDNNMDISSGFDLILVDR